MQSRVPRGLTVPRDTRCAENCRDLRGERRQQMVYALTKPCCQCIFHAHEGRSKKLASWRRGRGNHGAAPRSDYLRNTGCDPCRVSTTLMG